MAKVTTFYSYKGGSGRSMTMANVAWALATNGQRVLAIDWDLEAPGLHRYFHPFLRDPEQAESEGLIDRIWNYVEQIGGGEGVHGDSIDRFALASCADIVQQLELPTRSKGCLDLLGAGRQDDQYSAKVGGLDWTNFYARFDGETFVDRLATWARGSYDHVMIDSRTGVADTAGICTAQLPDTLVMCFVYNRQSIEGSAAIARSIVKARKPRGQPPLDVHFIPCRVEERGVVDSARRFAAARMGDALQRPRSLLERQLRKDEVRHYPWCAFEEKLAVFEDVPDERGSLLDTMHELARQITGRKKLRIEDIDPKLLTTIWRRAAFDDPRMADLGSIVEVPVDEAFSSLVSWIDAALEDEGERADWLMSLSETAISSLARAQGRQLIGLSDFFCQAGLELGRRAFLSDPAQHTTRYALLLQSISGQMQKRREFDRAFSLAEQSYELLRKDGSPTSVWRAARSLERMAEIRSSTEDYVEAISMYRMAANLYGSIDRRRLPIGAGLDPARSLRVLAEQLLAHGDPIEADRIAEHAVKLLGSLGNVSSRDATEIVNILATRAEITAFIGSDDADEEIRRVRILAGTAIGSPTAHAQLERRLHIAEARLELHRSNHDAALRELDQANQIDPTDPSRDILELRVGILMDAGRSDEAADLMLDAVNDRGLPPTPAFFELLRRVLAASGRTEAFDKMMVDVIGGSDGKRSDLLRMAVEWLVSDRSASAGGGSVGLKDAASSRVRSERPPEGKVDPE